MAYFRNNSTNQVLDSKIYVVNKSSIPVKVNGLGPGGKPLIIRPTPEYVVSIQQKSISNQAEQTLIITGNEVGSAVLYGYVDIGSNSASLTSIIRNGCVVQGFKDYPDLGGEQKRTIDSVRERANIGTDRKFLQYRSYMKNAISVAQREKVGIDPCPTKLYAWVKADSRSPGSNFVKFQTFAGQDFYTLTPGFLQDPLHPKK